MRSALLRGLTPLAHATGMQFGVGINATDRLQHCSRLPGNSLSLHTKSVHHRMFYSRLSTCRKLACPGKGEKDGKTTELAPRENAAAKKITRRVFFTDSTGQRHTCEAMDGESILNIAKSYNLDIEGACLGECACSTCHVIVTSKSYYDVMDSLTEREEDMLDLAFGLTLSSRLGCQIYVKPALDGIEFKLPGIEREKSGSL